jgi:tetratricopeptide (TPR) repeat protein
VLVTSRNAKIGDLISHKNIESLFVPALRKSEIKELITNILGVKGHDTSLKGSGIRLSKISPYPMDIILAGNMLKNPSFSIDGYIDTLYDEIDGANVDKSIEDFARDYMVRVVLNKLSILKKQIALLSTVLLFEDNNISADFLNHSFGSRDTKFFINTMKENSLLTVNNSNPQFLDSSVSINKVVYPSITFWLSNKKSPAAIENFVTLLDDYIQNSLLEESYSKVRNMLETMESLPIKSETFNLEQEKKIYYLFGKMYYFVGDYKLALESFEKCLQIKTLSKKIPQSYILKKIGDIYRRIEKYEQSISIYEKVFVLFSQEGEQKRIAQLVSDLANTYKASGLYQKAKENYKISLGLYKTLKDENMLAFTQARLGNLFIHLGDYKNAQKYLETALDSYLRIYGDADSKTSWVQTNLAYLYIETGFFAKADELLRKSLSTRHINFGENHAKTAWLYVNIGRLRISMNNFEEAKYYLTKAHDTYCKIFGENHTVSIRALGYLCELDLELGDFKGAKSKSTLVFDVFQKLYGDYHPKTAWALLLKAKSNIGSKNYKEGVQQLLTTIRVFKENEHVEQYQGELELGNYYALSSDHGYEAISHYKEALKILEKSFPADSSKLTIVHDKIKLIMLKKV